MTENNSSSNTGSGTTGGTTAATAASSSSTVNNSIHSAAAAIIHRRPLPRPKTKKRRRLFDTTRITAVAPPEIPALPPKEQGQPSLPLGTETTTPSTTKSTTTTSLPERTATTLSNIARNEEDNDDTVNTAGSLLSLDTNDPLLFLQDEGEHSKKNNTEMYGDNNNNNAPPAATAAAGDPVERQHSGDNRETTQSTTAAAAVFVELPTMSEVETNNDGVGDSRRNRVAIENDSVTTTTTTTTATSSVSHHDQPVVETPPTTTTPPDSKKRYDDNGMNYWEAMMSELEKIVVRAEEKEIMEKLNVAILEQEEEEVMAKLLQHRVHPAEDMDFAKRFMPSRVECLTQIPQSLDEMASSKRSAERKTTLEMDGDAKRGWDTMHKRKRRQNLESLVSSTTGNDGLSKVDGEPETITLIRCRQELPKWVSSPRNKKDGRSLLFARSTFWKKFYATSTFQLSEFKDDPIFDVTIFDRHPNYPDSYQLEAIGTEAQLEKVRLFTKKFIDIVIADQNIVDLWSDPRSLLLDLTVSCREKLGIVTNQQTYREMNNKGNPIPGVWIRKIFGDGTICNALGGNASCLHGCMVISVDDKRVFLAQHIVSNLEAGKEKNGITVTVQLCLSKYTDFSQMPKTLIDTLKRRDKVPFDPEMYDVFRKERENAMELSTDRTVDSFNDGRMNTDDDRGIEPVHETTIPPSRDTSAETKTAEKPVGMERYDMFVQKYRPLVPLEFKDTKINSHKILASMWKAHKVMFGDASSCDDTCTCFKATPSLKNAGLSADGNINVRNQTTGVMEYFLPRFILKLKEEYPQEGVSDLFERVVFMWKEHQSNRLYGLRCVESCQCGQEWDQLFGRGDKARSDAFKASARKKTWRSIPSLVEKTQIEKTDSSMRVASRNMYDTAPDVGHVGEKRKLVNDRPDHALSLKRRRSLVANDRPHIQATHNVRTNFEAVFDSSQPLGAYFVTGKGVDGVIGCQLFSKFEHGSAGKYHRIILGTTVTAVVMGDTRKDIHSHLELKGFYEHAKRSKKALNLLIETRGGLRGLVEDSSHWNLAGNWIGPRNDGWPGGAEDLTERQPVFESGLDLVRTSRMGQSVATQPSTPAQGQSDPLTDAVRTLNCKDLIKVLENAYPVSRAEVDTKVVSEYQFVRAKLKGLEDSLHNGKDADSMIVHSIQDWRAKYIALKICLGNIFAIEMAMTLKSWNIINFRVESLKLEANRASLLFGNKDISVSIQTQNPDSVLGTLPNRNFAISIKYGEGSKTFRVHNNFLFTSEHRFLVVNVNAVTRGEGGHATKLGSFVVPLNEIEKIFSSNGGWMAYTKQVHGLGSLEIVAQRFCADKAYVLQKKDECIRGLKKQVKTIENFNKDSKLPAYAKISGNVRGISGCSLLHAAIEVVDTTKLIEQLLHLNADPLASAREIGTPLDLANKFLERSDQKLKEAQKNGKPNSVIDAHRLRYLQAFRIKDLLQKKQNEPSHSSGPAASTREGEKSGTRRVNFAS